MAGIPQRLKTLETRLTSPDDGPVALFDHDGAPLNDAARAMTPEERARSRRITLTIDGPNLADLGATDAADA